MEQVTVKLQRRSYRVNIGRGLLAHAGKQAREVLPTTRRLVVITIPVVQRRWGKVLLASLQKCGFQVTMLAMPEGEKVKRLATVEGLAQKMVKAGTDRNAAVVAFGGGVTGDVAGFVASIYMRGIPVIQVPTTVVAQVDAAIGGKTGVNIRLGKNLLGSFHQPELVLVDPDLLSSLPEREFRSGLYEALKCGVIGDPSLFEIFEGKTRRLLKRDPATLQEIITKSVRLKAAVVSADEREDGLRAVLNFGHTIGHALEAETGYRSLLHGEAVAWGMIAATNISAELGRLGKSEAGRVVKAICGIGRLPPLKVSSRKIVKRLQADKKTRDGVVRFVLPSAIGKMDIVEGVGEKLVRESVDALRKFHR